MKMLENVLNENELWRLIRRRSGDSDLVFTGGNLHVVVGWPQINDPLSDKEFDALIRKTIKRLVKRHEKIAELISELRKEDNILVEILEAYS